MVIDPSVEAALIAFVGLIVSSVLAWHVKRNAVKVDTAAKNTEGATAALNAQLRGWTQFTDRLSTQILALQKENTDCNERVASLRRENDTLNQRVDDLEEQCAAFKLEIKGLRHTLQYPDTPPPLMLPPPA